MSDASQYRALAPGPSPPSEGSPPHEPGKSSSSSLASNLWKKRVSTACLACKKSKRKCSGVPPCDNCRAFNRVCIFDESLDQRRRVAAKRTADELNYHRDMLNDLFTLVRTADQAQAMRLLEVIRSNATTEEIREFIDETLSTIEASGKERQDTISKLEDIRRLIDVEGTSPSYRRKVMDIHYLCDEAPQKVPAKPWTRVTDDGDLVSHLISLFLAWDYPFHGFMDGDVFLRHMMAGDTTSELCSPFLVNAVLAKACHFSEYSEAYVVPGDIVTKGADFLAEAERLKEAEMGRVCLASLQATLLLHEWHSLAGDDDVGYIMLHQAIRMGETLGLIGKNPPLSPELGAGDLDSSIKRTAWGLFHVDTVVHTGFLRPPEINQVNVRRIDRNLSTEKDLWVPYPTHRGARPSFQSQYFDESCNLCEIAADISRQLFSDGQSGISQAMRRQRAEDLYERLRLWHGRLPDIFDPGRRPPPHIILLRMRYHTLVINLFICAPEDDISSTASDALKTPESQPRSSPIPKYNVWAITQSAARGISALARLHRREYGVNRSHQFAMYAVNLALFTMLDQESFDVLDQDFLSLVSAFSVMASRSTLGRNLFHIFRQTVRSKAQGKRIRESSAVSEELKDLLDEEGSRKGDRKGRYDEYAEGLEKLNQDEKYHGIGLGEGEDLQDYPGLGLFEMLDRYESLSLGKDEAGEKPKPEIR